MQGRGCLHELLCKLDVLCGVLSKSRNCIACVLALACRVSHPSSIYHCSVMPCYDKKLEASRDELSVPGAEKVGMHRLGGWG